MSSDIIEVSSLRAMYIQNFQGIWKLTGVILKDKSKENCMSGCVGTCLPIKILSTSRVAEATAKGLKRLRGYLVPAV